MLHLWEQQRLAGIEPVYALAEVLTSCAEDLAVVAVLGDEIIGAAVAREAHNQAWVVFHAVADEWRTKGLGSAMLREIETRMAGHNPSSLVRARPRRGDEARRVSQRGLHREEGAALLGAHASPCSGTSTPSWRRWADASCRAACGMRWAACVTRRTCWRSASCCRSRSRTSPSNMGSHPPRAVVLFGPPGTGKTTFAKAIASRLDWAFVEVFPSRLAADPAGLAGALRETFQRIDELEHAVVLIDEVEEIASHRRGDPPSPLQGVTNELLKIIPAFRERPDRLLVCATNFIRSLDSAFLRHGRFDYVIPIGLPDADAQVVDLGAVRARLLGGNG